MSCSFILSVAIPRVYIYNIQGFALCITVKWFVVCITVTCTSRPPSGCSCRCWNQCMFPRACTAPTCTHSCRCTFCRLQSSRSRSYTRVYPGLQDGKEKTTCHSLVPLRVICSPPSIFPYPYLSSSSGGGTHRSLHGTFTLIYGPVGL